MPTETTPPSAPSGRRGGTPGSCPRDVTPLSLTALAIIAILVLVLHVASGETVGRSHANSPIVAPAAEFNRPVDAKQPGLLLPFD
jgi:hypothetical protein